MLIFLPNQQWICSRELSYQKSRGQRVQRHMKGCSASLAIKEMQIKTTIRYNLTPVRVANINKFHSFHLTDEQSKLFSVKERIIVRVRGNSKSLNFQCPFKGIMLLLLNKKLFILGLVIETSSQDGSGSRHVLPLCTTASKLHLKYRATITQNHQKSSWTEVWQLWN